MAVRLSVIGAGYLGATHAACMAELGYEVVAVEVVPARLEALREGRVPFHEPGLDELLRRHVSDGRLRFTDVHAEAAAFADVHFLCVGTPQMAGGLAADGPGVAAADAMGPHLRPGALSSWASPPSRSAPQRRWLDGSRRQPERPVGVGWNPEFLREGHAVDDTLRPDRLVFGVADREVERLMRLVYAPLISEGVPCLVMDYATAELVKVAANAFLATKISFINAMAEVCEPVGADVVALAEAIGMDERIGPLFLQAGVGFGGGCLPKDIRAFRARAEELGVGVAVDLLAEVDRVNDRQRDRALAMAVELVGGSLDGVRVAVLGAAFKPNSDDVRDSPALAVAERARAQGADVVVHDPLAMGSARLSHPSLLYADTASDACTGADVVLHLTDWGEYRSLDPVALRGVVRRALMVDGRNKLDLARWVAAGWQVRAWGRPAPPVSDDGPVPGAAAPPPTTIQAGVTR